MSDAVLRIPISDILWVLGFIITLGGAWAVVRTFPALSHGRRIKALEEHDKKDYETLKILCKGVQALLHHAAYDGNTEEIEQAIFEFNKHLIEK